jgi:hypothetical protein
MVRGTLCIIGCPILEDEIIHSLRADEDEKKVYLADTPPSHTLKKKLERNGIPFVAVDEWEFDNGFVDIDEEAFNVVIIMHKLGLHSQPKVLRSTLEDHLKIIQGRVDVIALYYGMCGNAGWDVSRWASEELSVPVFVFRDQNEEVCDDCIGVAVGGHSRYYTFVKKYPGMLFVTPAIAENWGEFSKELDMVKGFEIMGIHSQKEVFELFGYKNAVKIDTGIGITGDELEEGCRRLAKETGLKFITSEPGFVNMYPTERIYKDAKGAMRR